MKPLDTELLDRLALENDAMITVEEGSRVSSVIIVYMYIMYVM